MSDAVTPAPPGVRYQALLELLRTADTIWNASRVFFAQWDLSPSQFNVLNLLLGFSDGLSQTELSRELIMHRSNLTGLIDRLEKRGLVTRTETRGDRRAWRIVLTPKARRLLREILPRYHVIAEQLYSDLPVGRAQQLLPDLRHLATRAVELSAHFTNARK